MTTVWGTDHRAGGRPRQYNVNTELCPSCRGEEGRISGANLSLRVSDLTSLLQPCTEQRDEIALLQAHRKSAKSSPTRAAATCCCGALEGEQYCRCSPFGKKIACCLSARFADVERWLFYGRANLPLSRIPCPLNSARWSCSFTRSVPPHPISSSCPPVHSRGHQRPPSAPYRLQGLPL